MSVPTFIKDWWGAILVLIGGGASIFGVRAGLVSQIDERIEAKVQPNVLHASMQTLERKLDDHNAAVRSDVRTLDAKVDDVRERLAGLEGERRARDAARPAESAQDAKFSIHRR